ncbi:MAG: formylglycine-generating enzyme family protein, partial [Planctomycetes bacterium]|nr:formylglycine-generating enzyme family protein [Planctomycetota bacterium]
GCRARLPGEAEWELAVRAGAPGPWAGQAAEGLVHAGSAAGHQAADSGPLNALGLAHGLGNVWEWCRDGYGPPPAGALAVDPPVAAGERGVARGGSYADPLAACRAANRVALDPATRSPCLGFRLVVEE